MHTMRIRSCNQREASASDCATVSALPAIAIERLPSRKGPKLLSIETIELEFSFGCAPRLYASPNPYASRELEGLVGSLSAPAGTDPGSSGSSDATKPGATPSLFAFMNTKSYVSAIMFDVSCRV